MSEKCQLCDKEYSPDCDYRQGRCPHHPPLIKLGQFIDYIKRLFRG